MSGYDFNRPMISLDSMEKYKAKDKETAEQLEVDPIGWTA